jgi:TonB family protein
MVLGNMKLLTHTRLMNWLWQGICTNHLMIASIFLVALMAVSFCWSVDAIETDKMQSLRKRIFDSQIKLYTRYFEKELESQWQPVQGLKDKAIILVTVNSDGSLASVIPSVDDKNSDEIQNQVSESIATLNALQPSNLGRALLFEARLLNNSSDVQLTHKVLHLEPYVARIVKDVKRRWTPPAEQAESRVRLYVRVYKDGTVKRTVVEKSSGFASFDSSAVKALAESSPLEALPPGSPNYIDVLLTFDAKAKKFKDDSANSNGKAPQSEAQPNDEQPTIYYDPSISS